MKLLALLLSGLLLLPVATSASEEIPDMFDRLANSVVLIWYQDGASPYLSAGTGFAIDTLGHIMTCAHVVEGVKTVTISVGTESGEENYPATVVMTQPKIDAAILKTEYRGLKPVPFGDSKFMRTGQQVGYIGFPLGYTVDIDVVPSLTMGYISSVRRWRIHATGPRVRMIQIDGSISLGSSGSPVFEVATGKVIGMIKSQIHTPGPVLSREDVLGAIQSIPDEMAVSAGTGLAVPINIIKTFLEQTAHTRAVEEKH